MVTQQYCGVDGLVALAYIETYAGEWITILKAHKEDIARLDAVGIRGSEQTSSGAGGIEELYLIVCDFLYWVGTLLER